MTTFFSTALLDSVSRERGPFRAVNFEFTYRDGVKHRTTSFGYSQREALRACWFTPDKNHVTHVRVERDLCSPPQGAHCWRCQQPQSPISDCTQCKQRIARESVIDQRIGKIHDVCRECAQSLISRDGYTKSLANARHVYCRQRSDGTEWTRLAWVDDQKWECASCTAILATQSK